MGLWIRKGTLLSLQELLGDLGMFLMSSVILKAMNRLLHGLSKEEEGEYSYVGENFSFFTYLNPHIS